MTSINGIDPTGLPHAILAPTPNRERFRLRVEVFLPQDAHSYNAKPYHSFVIAKSRTLNLPELSLRELRDTVIYRYKTIYPNETLFQISKTTNALGDDLFLEDAVGDIFADNEVFRVIKGASIRESLPRNYRESREASLQPSHNTTRKRSPNTSNMGDLSRAGKRQRFHEPERPIPSIERFAVIDEEDEGSSLGQDRPGSEGEDADLPDAEEARQGDVEAFKEADVNGASAPEGSAIPPVVQSTILPGKRGRPSESQSAERATKQPTPISVAQIGANQSGSKTADPPKKRGRTRKSMNAALATLPQETRRTTVSTSPILPPTLATIKKSSSTTSVATGFEALRAFGSTAKSSHMLPPPIIPQRQLPRPISPPDAADATPKPAPASSPAMVGVQNGASSAKKGRRVSFAEPSPPVPDKTVHNASANLPPASPAAQILKITNGNAASAGIVDESAQAFQPTPSAETAIEDDTADERSEEEDESASKSQTNGSTMPTNDGKLSKRKASSISVYEQERLAKKLAAEEKKKLAAEKKAEKHTAREAKAKAKANAKAEAKEAKRKEKEERKLASSSQKAANAEAKAPPPSTPAASATVKTSVPITDDGADTPLSGVTEDVTAAISASAPVPESIPAPPSSPIMPAGTPKHATPGSKPDRSPSEASSPGSVSTSRSQRDSRSPVHFVTANSKAASKESFPGSGQKQGNGDGSESEEGSSSDEEDDDLDTASASKPKTPAQTPKEKTDVASTQSMRSTSYIPPPSQPRFSEIRDAYNDKRRLSTTPMQPSAAKFNKDNSLTKTASRASDSPAPSQSQRPAAMAHLPSLKNQAAQAIATRNAEMERIRLEGQAKAKALRDSIIAKRKEEKEEESEAETDSSSGNSDSDSDGSSSDSDAKKSTPKNKLLMGLKGGAAPASASKAEGRKKKKPDFGGIKKRFSLGSSLR